MAAPQVVVLLNALEAHGRFGSLEPLSGRRVRSDNLTASDTVAKRNWAHYSAWQLRAAPARIISLASSAADIQLLDLFDHGFDGSDITVDVMGTQMSLRLSIPGKGGVTNALAAIAAAMALDIDVSLIVQGIEALSPVEGRGNTLHLERGIRLIEDEATRVPPASWLPSTSHATTAHRGPYRHVGVR